MKLHINHEQNETSEGCFGGTKGVSFTLKLKLDATATEVTAIQKQKLDEKALSTFPFEFMKNQEQTIYVESILNHERGYHFRNLGLLQRVEREVTEGCKILKSYVEGAEGFGGSKSVDL